MQADLRLLDVPSRVRGKHGLVGGTWAAGGRVVVTTHNAVHAFRANGKRSRSWRGGLSYTFTVPAVSVGRRLMTAHEEHLISFAREDSSDLTRAEKAKVASRVHSLWTRHSARDDDDVLVVHMDGTFTWASSNLERVDGVVPRGSRKGSSSSSDHVRWADVRELAQGTTTVFLGVTRTRGTHMRVVELAPGKTFHEYEECPLSHPMGGEDVLAAMSLAPDASTLAVLWGDGTMAVYDVKKSATRVNLSLRTSRQLAGFGTTTVREGVGLVVLSAMHTCTVVRNVSARDYELILWENRYGTPQGSRVVPLVADEESEESRRVMSQAILRMISAVSESGPTCVLFFDCAAVMCTIDADSPSLALALGQLAGFVSTRVSWAEIERARQPLLSGVANLQNLVHKSSKDTYEIGEALSTKEETVHQVFADTVDPAETRTLAVLAALRNDPRPTEESLTQMLLPFLPGHQREEKTGSCPRVLELSGHLVETAVEKCVKHRFWHLLARLLETCVVSSRACPYFLPAILEGRHTDLLEKFLLYVNDVSETDLIRVLRFAESIGDVKDHAAGAVCEKLMCLIVTTPYGSAFLQASLRSLSTQEVLILLRFLTQRMVHLSTASATETHPADHDPRRTPSMGQVLDWLSLVLDAHFASLALSSEAHPVLEQVRDLVARETRLCSSVQSLRGILSHYQQRGALPIPEIPEFSVETLKW